MNWINSWGKGNKKAKYELSFRLGRLTVIEIKLCLFCKVEECNKSTNKQAATNWFNL